MEKIEIQGRIFLGHHLLSRLQIIQTQTKVCISKKDFEFVFAKNHYKNFTEKLSLTDKLNQVEDYTGYHIQSLQTQNIVLFVVIFSIGILVLCFCLYQKMCCCQKRPYSDNK